MGKPEGRFSGMVFSGFALDPAKSNQLSLGEKRKLVHEVIEFSEDAPKILSSLTRRELLEIICAEMGKERKYSGFSKIRMIEQLLKVVSDKYKKKNTDKNEAGFKKQRKHEHLLHLPGQLGETIEKPETVICDNLVCRATMRGEDVFCKRCSCCICYQYDENKDPSLWLTCDSESTYEGESCGISCHLKCAVTHKQAGILMNGIRGKLNGGFYCVSCGKVNGLMRTWRKQLLAAKEARRVDILCLRVSLSHKILQGTEQYMELLKIVESAAKMLEKEVGPLDWASKKMDRGIVNRLSCGTEVQKLCASALEAFDFISSNACSYHMDHKEPPMFRICFEKLSPTSVTVVLVYEDHLFKDLFGCKLWHRKSTSKDYPPEATYIVLRPEKRFELTNLDPSTEYTCKVSFFSNAKMLGIWEAKWVTPGSNRSSISVSDKRLEERRKVLKLEPDMGPVTNYDDVSENKADGSHVPGPTSYPPSTPGKSDGITKTSSLERMKEPKESDYDYSVRVIRRLEHEGHLDRDFRVKFLTWFSLKATTQERKVVSVFVSTFIDDPKCLAAQLIDTFADEICGNRKQVPQHGFCARLWH